MADPASLIGQTISHYRILEKLGEGGMGVVYRAHDEQLHRDVALKVLPGVLLGDPKARARLRREAQTAAALNHPNVCAVYEVGEADGVLYIAMEFVNGKRQPQTVLTAWLVDSCLGFLAIISKPSRVARPARSADGLIGPAQAFAR